MRTKRPVPRPREGGRKAQPVPKLRAEQRTGPLHVEIVASGRELLRGRQADVSAHYVAGKLSQRGAIVHRIVFVDDNETAIASALTDALRRGARLLVTVGGLGPTADDRTRVGVADALHLPLAPHPHAKEMVEEAYRGLRQRGIVGRTGMTAAREAMCLIPIGGEPIPNSEGVAPGFLVRIPGGATVVSLPGLPAETRGVFEAACDRLRDVLPKASVAVREVEAPTSDESALRPLLDRLAEEYPRVWITTHAPGARRAGVPVLVRLEAAGSSRQEAESTVENALQRLLALSGGG